MMRKGETKHLEVSDKTTADDFIRLFDATNANIAEFAENNSKDHERLRLDLSDVDKFKDRLVAVITEGPMVIPQIDPRWLELAEERNDPSLATDWLFVLSADEMDNFSKQWEEIERKLRERAKKESDDNVCADSG